MQPAVEALQPATSTLFLYPPLFWNHLYFPFHPQQVRNSGAVTTLHKQVLQLILNLDIYSPSCRQRACLLTKSKSPSASLCHSWFYRNWPSPELRISFWNSVPLFRSCSISPIIPDVFPCIYYTSISWDIHSSKHSTFQIWHIYRFISHIHSFISQHRHLLLRISHFLSNTFYKSICLLVVVPLFVHTKLGSFLLPMQMHWGYFICHFITWQISVFLPSFQFTIHLKFD